jgi:hypothetical protein
MNVGRRTDFLNSELMVIPVREYYKTFLPNDLAIYILRFCNIEDQLSGNLDVVSYQFYRIINLLRDEFNPHFVKLCNDISENVIRMNLFSREVFNTRDSIFGYNHRALPDSYQINVNFAPFYNSLLNAIKPCVILPYAQIEGDKNFNLSCPVIEEPTENKFLFRYGTFIFEACPELKLELRKVAEEVVKIVNGAPEQKNTKQKI